MAEGKGAGKKVVEEEGVECELPDGTNTKDLYHNSASTPEDERERDKYIEEVVRMIIVRKDYVKPQRCKVRDELAELSEDRFCESFFESAPQAILQLFVSLELGLNYSFKRLFSVFFSFASLALTILAYMIDAIQKNPVRRIPNLIGKLVIFLAKAPAVVSRCIAFAIFFTSETLEVSHEFVPIKRRSCRPENSYEILMITATHM